MKRLPQINPTSTIAWKKLKDFNSIESDIRKKSDILHIDGISVDFSNTNIFENQWDKLYELLNECDFSIARDLFFSGYKINETEDRSVLHPWLRNLNSYIEHKEYIDILNERVRMKDVIHRIHSNKFLPKGEKISNIVHIGIGGSDLGPRMIVKALSNFKIFKGNIYFVNTLDPNALQEVLDVVNYKQTLFIISSKSFTTPETLNIAKIFKDVLSEKLGSSWSEYFIAITANPQLAESFGVKKHNIIKFSQSICGRFSMWGPVGLIIGILIGNEMFEEFLSGGEEIDHHFKNERSENNIPIKMALCSLYHINFRNIKSEVILPYTEMLSEFPKYLRQICLESNGKSVDRNGKQVNYRTAVPIFGEVGIQAQHSFFQWLHQGKDEVLTDFIIVRNLNSNFPSLENQILSNAYGQIEALTKGRPKPNILELPFDEHKIFKGGKSLLKIELDSINPKNLGKLCALYEHKYFSLGVLWNIFSFDQWGVELGKEKAKEWLSKFNNEFGS